MQPTNLRFQPPAAGLFNPLLLTKEDVDACFTLQEEIRAMLIKQGTPHYLKPLTKEGFAKHLEDGGEILGIRDEKGTLVAIARLSFPANPNAPELAENFPGIDLTNTAIVGGIGVIKNGFSLSSVLLEAAKQVAADHGCFALVGKVALANKASHHQFEKADFGLAATGMDTKHDVLDADYAFACFRWPTPSFKVV